MSAEVEFEKLSDCVEDNVCWSRGSSYPWEGDALLSAEFLEALLNLAFLAPKADRDNFIGAFS